MPDLFKEVIPAIMVRNENIFDSDKEVDDYYVKSSWIINKTLSMYNDCVIPANLMNINNHLDGKLKNDFYINTISGYKRKFNYVKSEADNNNLDNVMEYYNVSRQKAMEYIEILNATQLETITKRLNRGGIEK